MKNPNGRGRRIGRAAAAALLALAAAGCKAKPEPAAPSDAWERIRAEGVVRVGYANEAPFAYLDPATDRLTGEAPENARKIFGRMGVPRIEGVLTEFGSLIPALKARRFDVIAAGMYITPERCKEAAFSNPTYSLGEAFVVRKGNPLGLRAYEDAAKHASARLGVVAGTVEFGYARSLGVPEERIVVFPDAPSALDGVKAGRADAYAGTSLTVNDLLGKYGGDALERAEPFRNPVIDGEAVRGYGAFVFRKEDAALLDRFNRELARWIGSPEHLAVVRAFGFTEAELPGDVTAKHLCGKGD